MRGYYDILEKLRVSLEANPSINTVTEGDLLDVDLAKQTIFPLSHIIVQNATLESTTITFNLNILFMDLVDFNKDDPKTDIPFRGNDNEQDVLNTMLAAANKLWSDLSRGDLFVDKYQVSGSPSCEPFVERFDNQVAGWDMSVSITIANTDISVC
jgi:hypothetical protein